MLSTTTDNKCANHRGTTRNAINCEQRWQPPSAHAPITKILLYNHRPYEGSKRSSETSYALLLLYCYCYIVIALDVVVSSYEMEQSESFRKQE